MLWWWVSGPSYALYNLVVHSYHEPEVYCALSSDGSFNRMWCIALLTPQREVVLELENVYEKQFSKTAMKKQHEKENVKTQLYKIKSPLYCMCSSVWRYISGTIFSWSWLFGKALIQTSSVQRNETNYINFKSSSYYSKTDVFSQCFQIMVQWRKGGTQSPHRCT